MWGRQGVPVRGSASNDSSSLAVDISVVLITSNEGHISVLQLNTKETPVGVLLIFNNLLIFHDFGMMLYNRLRIRIM